MIAVHGRGSGQHRIRDAPASMRGIFAEIIDRTATHSQHCLEATYLFSQFQGGGHTPREGDTQVAEMLSGGKKSCVQKAIGGSSIEIADH